jgi:hypothetical protein
MGALVTRYVWNPSDTPSPPRGIRPRSGALWLRGTHGTSPHATRLWSETGECQCVAGGRGVHSLSMDHVTYRELVHITPGIRSLLQ